MHGNGCTDAVGNEGRYTYLGPAMLILTHFPSGYRHIKIDHFTVGKEWASNRWGWTL